MKETCDNSPECPCFLCRQDNTPSNPNKRAWTLGELLEIWGDWNNPDLDFTKNFLNHLEKLSSTPEPTKEDGDVWCESCKAYYSKDSMHALNTPKSTPTEVREFVEDLYQLSERIESKTRVRSNKTMDTKQRPSPILSIPKLYKLLQELERHGDIDEYHIKMVSSDIEYFLEQYLKNIVKELEDAMPEPYQDMVFGERNGLRLALSIITKHIEELGGQDGK